MTPGFHCSCLEFHDTATLIPQLAALGFRAVAIRPRRGGWDPDLDWFQSASAEISAAAKEHDVAIIVDLDSPYYDDARTIEPFSLASPDTSVCDLARAKIQKWIELAGDISPLAITFSTGRVAPSRVPSPVAESLAAEAHKTEKHGIAEPHGEVVLERLAAAIGPLVKQAASAGVNLALRPVSEHAIATVAHFERFEQWLASGTPLGLAADVGEMLLGGEFPIGARLARLQHRLTCVYLCEPDLDRGCDQRFGHGDIDLGRVWEVMTESGFRGPGIFRACGHGRMGLDAAREALALLDPNA